MINFERKKSLPVGTNYQLSKVRTMIIINHTSSYLRLYRYHTFHIVLIADKYSISLSLLKIISAMFVQKPAILLSTAMLILAISHVACFSIQPAGKQWRLTLQPLQMSKGCAAKPFDKKKVAIFGAGGYLGSTIYGFLQRASSIYGTGISGVSSSPRAICATATGFDSLNKLLGRSFKLAFASENFIRLTNMQEMESIEARIRGYDAAVIGTIYQLEKRPITGGSYDVTPNDKTLEFYLDNRNMVEATVADDDMDVHFTLFQNSIDACKAAGIEHVVVIETPATKDSKPFAKIIDESGINFTYIHTSGELENTKFYTFEEGIQSELDVQGFTLPNDHTTKNGYKSGDWSDSFVDDIRGNVKENVPREDLAAVVVQSLLSLDWNRSRCIDISSVGPLTREDDSSADKPYVPAKILKSDKDWCMKSEILAEKMSIID